MSHVGLLPRKRDLSYVTVVPMCHRLHSNKDTCRCGWVDSKHRHERKDEEEKYMTRYVCSSADIHCNCLIR